MKEPLKKRKADALALVAATLRRDADAFHQTTDSYIEKGPEDTALLIGVLCEIAGQWFRRLLATEEAITADRAPQPTQDAWLEQSAYIARTMTTFLQSEHGRDELLARFSREIDRQAEQLA